MNLEQVTAELRPRGAWEAADFGARLIRRDAVEIYKTWFALTLPLIGLALLAIYFGASGMWVFIVYWWLEPITDGPILHIISRRLFGENIDHRAALKAAPGLAWRNKLFWLTPYRFHFARSIAIPVVQLEGLSGTKRRERSAVLNHGIYNYGVGVSTAYQHLFLSLYLGVVLFGYLLVPLEYHDSVGITWLDQFWESDSRVSALLALLLAYAAQSVLHPWFVGCGFGLYINRRTELEAWDVEVAFRRMVLRRQAGASAAAMATMVLVLFAPLLLSSTSVRADDEEPVVGYWSDEEVVPAVDTIYAKDELNTSRETTRWAPIEQSEKRDRKSSGIWRSIGVFIGIIAEIGLWLGIGIFLIFLVATRQRWLPYLSRIQKQKGSEQRVLLAGGEVRAEDLPADIPAAVMSLWQSGAVREALSLMYRAAVFRAVSDHGIRIPRSATEGACVTAVQDQAADTGLAKFFGEVATAWIWCAYGGREVPAENIAALCDAWPTIYGDKA